MTAFLTWKLLAVASMLVAAGWYAIQAYRQKISPTITTWVVFGAASGLSLWTYFHTAPEDASVNILNFADPMAVVVIIISTLLFTDYKTHLDKTHSVYALGVLVSFFVWLISEANLTSNIMTQLIMFLGYWPTAQTLIQKKENTESYVMWVSVAIAAIAASMPALEAGDIPTYIYVGRTLVMAGIILALMLWYDIRQPAINRVASQ